MVKVMFFDQNLLLPIKGMPKPKESGQERMNG